MRHFLALLWGCAACAVSAVAQPDLLRFINPFIGTGGHGHTFPGATAPFGLVQLSPDTRLEGWDGCAGYHYTDRVIYGFSHTHLSGTGVPDYCDVLFAPFRGAMPFDKEDYASPFDKNTEQAAAGYYAVTLAKHNVRAEMTATPHTGVHRYTFPNDGKKNGLVIDLRHRDSVLASSLRIVNDREIEGTRFSNSWAKNQQLYFVTRFSQPFSESLVLDMAANPRVAQSSVQSRAVVGALQFRPSAQPLVVATGISAVSLSDARAKLEAQCADLNFERVKQETQAKWRQQMAKVTVTGGSDAQKTAFYTALYHTMCVPNLIRTNPDRYTVFSLWDTYRAANPLYTLLEPTRTAHFIQSFLEHYQKVGRLPMWELWDNETDCMIANHAIPVIVDAYQKGIRDFDANLVMKAMRETANQSLYGLNYYRKYGYVPADLESESVSKTLEYAFDDWCIGQMAGTMGDTATQRQYWQRAHGYQHLFDPQTGFFRAKSNATWYTPFEPTEVNVNYTEANAWQYRFAVPHDVQGLSKALGGPEKMAQALDGLFAAHAKTTGREQVDITGLIGQYAHGNEPSHHVAYLYNYVGQPWKTQQRIRQIMDELYTDQPDGLSGNEDCGQMSAWYVLSALGFYPVVPGRAEYTIGTPLFAEATLHLPNGKNFTVRAAGASAAQPYIQQATLNGQPLQRLWLTHEEILRGGELVLTMQGKPSTWGTAPAAWPTAGIPAQYAIVPVPFVAAGSRTFTKQQSVALGHANPQAAIFYAWRTNGKLGAFQRYTKPLVLNKSSEMAFYAEQNGQRSATEEAAFSQLADQLVVKSYATPYNPQYTAGGQAGLVDGLRGERDFRLGRWQGFEGKDVDVVVDLGKKRTLRKVSAGFLQDENAWIFYPSQLEVFGSADGQRFELLGSMANTVLPTASGGMVQDLSVMVPEAKRSLSVRYIRVVGKALGQCPAWHKGAGNACWLFIDEILVE